MRHFYVNRDREGGSGATTDDPTHCCMRGSAAVTQVARRDRTAEIVMKLGESGEITHPILTCCLELSVGIYRPQTTMYSEVA